MSSSEKPTHQFFAAEPTEVAIHVCGLGKCYQIYNKPQDRLKQAFGSLLAKPSRHDSRQYYQEFWALKDSTFSIKKGQTVGIIGLNGSGKSTLLQLICGTLTPSIGDVQIQGRVAALLELGSGFNLEFSGRDNIIMYASILGLSRSEIETCYDQIVAFADIGEFIDRSVKTYSSGMVVRLAFAVIAHVNADILVIDEALSVGDAVFTQKCMRFLKSFQQHGTLLFVSHDIAAVQNLCDTSIWLSHGRVEKIGASKKVAEAYLQHSLQATYGEDEVLRSISTQPDNSEREGSIPVYQASVSFEENLDNAKGWKTDVAEVTEVRLQHLTEAPGGVFQGGERVRLCIKALAYQDFPNPILGFIMRDRLGQDLFGENTLVIENNLDNSAQKGNTISAEFDFILPMLPNGDYAVMASIASGDMDNNIQHHLLHDACVIKVFSSQVRWGLVGLQFEKVSLNISLQD